MVAVLATLAQGKFEALQKLAGKASIQSARTTSSGMSLMAEEDYSPACVSAFDALDFALSNNTVTDAIESALSISSWMSLQGSLFCNAEPLKEFFTLANQLETACVTEPQDFEVLRQANSYLRLAKMIEQGVCLQMNNSYCVDEVGLFFRAQPIDLSNIEQVCEPQGCMTQWSRAVRQWHNDQAMESVMLAFSAKMVCDKYEGELCAPKTVGTISGPDAFYLPFNQMSTVYCNPCMMRMMALSHTLESDQDNAALALYMCRQDGAQNCWQRAADYNASHPQPDFVGSCQTSFDNNECSANCSSQVSDFVANENQGCCAPMMAVAMIKGDVPPENPFSGPPSPLTMLQRECGMDLPVCTDGRVETNFTMVLRNLRSDVFNATHQLHDRLMGALGGDLAMAFYVLQDDVTIDTENVQFVNASFNSSSSSMSVLSLSTDEAEAAQQGVLITVFIRSSLAEQPAIIATRNTTLELTGLNGLDPSIRYVYGAPSSYDVKASVPEEPQPTPEPEPEPEPEPKPEDPDLPPSSAAFASPSSVTLMLLLALFAVLF